MCSGMQDKFGFESLPKITLNTIKFIEPIDSQNYENPCVDPNDIVYEAMVQSNFLDKFKNYLENDPIFSSPTSRFTWDTSKNAILQLQLKCQSPNEAFRISANQMLHMFQTRYKTNAVNSISSKISTFLSSTFSNQSLEKQLEESDELMASTLAKSHSQMWSDAVEMELPIKIHLFFKTFCQYYVLSVAHAQNTSDQMIYAQFYLQGVSQTVSSFRSSITNSLKFTNQTSDKFTCAKLLNALPETDVQMTGIIPETADNTQNILQHPVNPIQQPSLSSHAKLVTNDVSTPSINSTISVYPGSTTSASDHKFAYKMIIEDKPYRRYATFNTTLYDVLTNIPNKYVYYNGQPVEDFYFNLEPNCIILVIYHAKTRLVNMDIHGSKYNIRIPENTKIHHILSEETWDHICNRDHVLFINKKRIHTTNDIPSVLTTVQVLVKDSQYSHPFSSYFPKPMNTVYYYLLVLNILAFGNIFPLLYHPQSKFNLNIAAWNMQGNFDTLLPFAKAYMVEQSVHLIFLSETQKDGNKLNGLKGGLRIVSDVIYDDGEHPRPHYGMALLVLDENIARSCSAFHVSPFQISVMINGYVVNGFYRRHRTHLAEFTNELFQLNNENQISIGDANYSLFYPRNNSDRQAQSHVNDLNYEIIEKDSHITRYPTIRTQQPSDLDHIILASHLVPFVNDSQGKVYFVPRDFSDHDIVQISLKLPVVHNTIKSAKYRIKMLKNEDKRTLYHQKLTELLGNENIQERLSNNKITFRQISKIVKDVHKCIQKSLNECIGKMSPKSIQDIQMPNLIHTQDLHTIDYEQYINMIKTDKMNGITKYQEYLQSLLPSQQLQFLKSKTFRLNQRAISGLDVQRINEYNQQLTTPMVSHPNLSFNDIQEEFNKYSGECHQINDQIFEICVKQLPNRKSYGIKDIPNESIKHGPDLLKGILKLILQTMIENGYVPDQFGNTTLIPVPKVSTPSSMDQYRGISLLFTIRKLYESYLYQVINIRFPNNQFGFAKNSSINDALKHLESLLHSRNRNGQRVQFIAFIDLRKAYDMIDRRILLRLFNICNRFLVRLVLNLVRITHLTLMVLQSHSNPINTTAGIPQGSSLSPSIFGFCLNDLYSISNDMVQSLYYADDCCLVAYSKHALIDSIHTMQEYLVDIGLQINFNKSIIICSNQYNGQSICGIQITTQSQRYLGFYVSLSGIDKNLVFKKKLNAIKMKMSQLRSLGVFRNGLPLSICGTILTAHLIPVIDFTMHVIRFSSNQHKKLESLIRKHLKLILGSTMSMPNPLLKSIVTYPNISKRNEYLFNKHNIHFNWRFHVPYQDIHCIKESGKISFHPFIIGHPQSRISKLLKWNFKPSSRDFNCSICHESHHYLQKRLKCYSYNKLLLQNMPTQSIVSNNHASSDSHDTDNQNDVTNLFDGYTFACDASLNDTNMGIGFCIVPPNSLEIDREFQFKMLNSNPINPTCSTELECIAINACIEYANSNFINNYRIFSDNKGAISIYKHLKEGTDPSKIQFFNHFTNLKSAPEISWIKAHAGHHLNERADQLAKTCHNAPIRSFYSTTTHKKILQNRLFLFDFDIALDGLNNNQIAILERRIGRFMQQYNLH
eukprot:NODE_99_length_20465_cov_0.827654.p1 type:complete len:1600 gc:universal NODE_99_length_20465_cov_0.827654:15409-20208(+)